MWGRMRTGWSLPHDVRSSSRIFGGQCCVTGLFRISAWVANAGSDCGFGLLCEALRVLNSEATPPIFANLPLSLMINPTVVQQPGLGPVCSYIPGAPSPFLPLQTASN